MLEPIFLTVCACTCKFLPHTVTSYSTSHFAVVSSDGLEYFAFQGIPDVELSVLTAAYHHSVSEPQARPYPEIGVGVASVILQYLAIALIHEPNGRVQRRNEDRVAVASLLNRSDGLYMDMEGISVEGNG